MRFPIAKDGWRRKFAWTPTVINDVLVWLEHYEYRWVETADPLEKVLRKRLIKPAQTGYQPLPRRVRSPVPPGDE